MQLKQGIRILALDEGAFTKKDKKVLVVGIIGRDRIIEGMLSFNVKVDGSDATERLLNAIKKSRFIEQMKLITMNGITFGGLNIVDMERISNETKMPIIGITRTKPHKTLLIRAIMKNKGSKERLKLLRKLHKRISIFRVKGYYVQAIGINAKSVEGFVSTVMSLLRLAHIVATGVSSGESKGRI